MARQPATARAGSVWYVYIIQQVDNPDLKMSGRGSRLYYVGISPDPTRRLVEHNNGENRSTSGGKWHLVTTLPFSDKETAALVEKWLKNGDTRQKREGIINSSLTGMSREKIAGFAYWEANRWRMRRAARRGTGRGGMFNAR